MTFSQLLDHVGDLAILVLALASVSTSAAAWLSARSTSKMLKIQEEEREADQLAARIVDRLSSRG